MPEPGSVWGGSRLDLDAYLARIGFQGDRRPTLETLRHLHARHSAAIAFENVDVVLGRPVPLDLETLQTKLVHRHRGGYCYEQNLLYAAALDRLGFQVSGLGARVRMGDDRLRPVTHALLKVEIDGEDFLTDVGFGGSGLLEPLPLRDGIEARQGGWTFALAREKDTRTWALRFRTATGWTDLYAFGTEQRYPVDYTVFNHYISTHPRSPFVRRLVVQRPLPGLRAALIGRQLTRTRPDWTTEVRDIPPQETPDVLASAFGITLSAPDAAALVAFQRDSLAGDAP
ncbi:arylamine N-acetyltransferase family protein [Streptomyces gilvosporeus]|uniref:Acetyltransferase n=1 Tax=Streptomyces gilvosporeus TaxID=553510 RepID=A0A1V0TVG4_9ACTN|nr:arylamine N-acetyltransferase [Streptomyces gilvosporeus]ARF56692.1 acetyltransferase [Streptomyces gilvosporeus]